MTIHRMRATPAPKGEKPYCWLEVEPDSWLPVEKDDLPTIGLHATIHAFLEREKTSLAHTIRYAERAFRIGIIKGPITELAPIE